MSSDEMIMFRVAPAGFTPQIFKISRRLVCSGAPAFKAYLDILEEDSRMGMSEAGILLVKATNPNSHLGWQGFFEWVHRGTFTIPELTLIAAGRYPGNKADNIRNLEERILQTYYVANRLSLVDLENKVMDVLYYKGRLMRNHLDPLSMRFILRRIPVNTKMQTYCAITIAIVLSRQDCWFPAVVDRYADLAADIPELLRQTFRFQASIACHDLEFPDLIPHLHNYWGRCAFHQHPNGEDCYLENEFRPLTDWDDDSDDSSGDGEVEMVDRGTQTEEIVTCHSDAQRQVDMGFGGEYDEMEEENRGTGVNNLDVADTVDDIPRVAKKRRVCFCTENEKRHMLHNCR
ncbi:hypothetical protein BKA65DRAFT_571922 [Rhexocercosporidium sp. MPI-PUGE-AT-0058]|nr:hypothetical protein BKA65DRAFT_571922 [Rhexocercosporidium sp. MPI-PUGE-AT-0058]